jgi:hypothetical protein
MNQNNHIAPILSLFHDPFFVKFVSEQEPPSIFKAVGRTFTETWHSALLGWLLDPQGRHALRDFPLRRFILLLKTEDYQDQQRDPDLSELLVSGDFSSARVRPNEREPSEVAVRDVGKFDVLVDRITLPSAPQWVGLEVLVEMKVGARLEKEQLERYSDYVERQKAERIGIIPCCVAPKHQLLHISGQQRFIKGIPWIGINYQRLYDEVLEPCLNHPDLSGFGRFAISEYINALKYFHVGGEPMVVTRQDHEMVTALVGHPVCS